MKFIYGLKTLWPKLRFDPSLFPYVDHRFSSMFMQFIQLFYADAATIGLSWGVGNHNGFSGTVPFICSIANGEQDVQTSYTNNGSMALLEGFSTPLQLLGNGSALLNLVLTQISGPTSPVFQLFGNIDGFSYLNPKSSNSHSDSHTTLLTQTPKTLTYQLRAFVENAYSGGELQFQAVLTCLDV